MLHLEWLTITEACSILRVSRRTLYTDMESGRLPYYQHSGNGHRRIRAEDLDRLMIFASSPDSACMNGGSEKVIGDIGPQERRPGILTIERDYSWIPEYYKDLEQMRPLGVWAGHPCALCGGTLRGVVDRKVAQALLKQCAHKECLTERDRGSFLSWGFASKLYEAE